MKRETTSNYEKQCEEWRQRFLGMNQIEICRRLPEFKREGEYLTILHFGRKLGIHTKSGHIVALEDKNPVSLTVKLNLYTLIWFCKPNASFTGEWLPFARLRGAGPFGPAYQKSIPEAFAATFASKADILADTFQRMGGLRLDISDVGYQLNGFDCIPVQFYFWDADDEFPAQANLLFDSSATDFIHVESIVSIASEGILRIAEMANVPLKGRSFQALC